VSYGSGPHLPVDMGSGVVTCPMTPNHCRYPADQVPLHISFKSRQVTGCASTRCHVPYGSGPRLSSKVGFDVVTCPMAPDLNSRLRVGSGAVMCPMAPDLAVTEPPQK
jgi:hypothetical protein